jgi:5-carboxyvanillate decarboxylase
VNAAPFFCRFGPFILARYTRSTSAAPPIAYIRKVISPERMLYAMDYPWQFVPEEVGALDAMGIGEEGLKQFFEGNARRLFKI